MMPCAWSTELGKGKIVVEYSSVGGLLLARPSIVLQRLFCFVVVRQPGRVYCRSRHSRQARWQVSRFLLQVRTQRFLRGVTMI